MWLAPFKYSELNLLALSGCGMGFSPRLDAYQVLTNHTIDKASYLFLDISYFEHVAGEAITEQVRKIISYERITEIHKSNFEAYDF